MDSLFILGKRGNVVVEKHWRQPLNRQIIEPFWAFCWGLRWHFVDWWWRTEPIYNIWHTWIPQAWDYVVQSFIDFKVRMGQCGCCSGETYDDYQAKKKDKKKDDDYDPDEDSEAESD